MPGATLLWVNGNAADVATTYGRPWAAIQLRTCGYWPYPPSIVTHPNGTFAATASLSSSTACSSFVANPTEAGIPASRHRAGLSVHRFGR